MCLEEPYDLITKDGLTYLNFKRWQLDSQLIHCFTTRLGGVSTQSLSSLNLGFNRGDTKDNVLQNYQRVCEVLCVPYESLVLSKQVHDTNIIKVTSQDRGNGICYTNKWDSIDGMYTTEKKITLVTHYADCVPLFFYAPKHAMIGMAHAGWRGTVNEIAKKFIEIWVNTEHIPVEAIEVAIGPSIGACCFETDEEVASIFIKQFGNQPFITYKEATKKYHIDLWACNQHVLIDAGVKVQNIVTAGLCTSCHENLFFSHRKSNGKRGTLGAFMALS
ncbi:MAG: pgeF [Clostridia bacterium]|jgi:YfiH family protein|nr:pgeF [Clostridia bacterium]